MKKSPSKGGTVRVHISLLQRQVDMLRAYCERSGYTYSETLRRVFDAGWREVSEAEADMRAYIRERRKLGLHVPKQ